MGEPNPVLPFLDLAKRHAGQILLRPEARETINNTLEQRQPPAADDGGGSD